jgi:DNA modification methylase
MTAAEVQSLLLRVLAAGGDTRLGRGRHYFSEAVIAASTPQNRPTHRQIMEAVWSLIGQGLAYIDYSQPAAENWYLYLTDAGRAAASDEEITPDDPGGYLRRLIVEIPELTPLVKSYAEENSAHTASAVERTGGRLRARTPDQFIVGDARELERLLGNESVDAIITSPPYLDLKDYGHGDQIGFGQSEKDYYDGLEDVFRQALAVTRDTGAFWLVIDTVRTSGELHPLPWLLVERALRVGWTLQETIVWDKGKTNPYSHPGRLRKLFEYIFLLTKKRDGFKWRVRRISELHRPQAAYFIGWPERHSPFGRNPGNVWRFPLTVQGVWSPELRAGKSVRQHLHQCPFPFGLVERLIELTTDPGDVVLDMFAGSGSVAAVAEATDRRWVAIEINPEYKRIFEEEMLRAATQHHEAGYWRRELLARELADEGVFNLKLRHLKFIRELARHTLDAVKTQHGAAAAHFLRCVIGICRTDPHAVVANRDYYHSADGKPYLEIDVYFAVTDGRWSEAVRHIADGLAKRRPLNKYSIEASVHAHTVNELDLHTLALAPDEVLYVYKGLRTHRYADHVAARQWKALLRKERKPESAPLIMANSAVLLPAPKTLGLLDRSAIVAKRRVLAYALKRHRGNIEKVAAALGISLYSLVQEMRALKTPLPARMPEDQRALLTAAKSISPAVWQANGDEAPYNSDDSDPMQ